MKTNRIMFFVVVLIYSFFTSMLKAGITDVYIIPDLPTVSDEITIFVEGIEATGPVNIYNTYFSINENSLTLDLYIEKGYLDVLSPWNYSENISTLTAGHYDLNVNEYLNSTLIQTYPLSFEVIPEPASLIILTFGSLLTFRRSRKRCSI